MHDIFKNTLQALLKLIAKAIVNKYSPQIIAVTGSFGKTSTKEAIFFALKTQLTSLRRNEASLNSQWGVPLTIIGATDPHGSVLKYLSAILMGTRLLIFHDHRYPSTLILEMGADKPGDIDYLLSITRPQVSVLTGLGHTHLEYFGAVDKVAKEKLKLINALPARGLAVINNDNPLLKEFITQPSVRYLTYGLQADSEVRATDVNPELNDLPVENTTANDPSHIGGVGFRIIYQTQSVQAYMPNLLGQGYIHAALAACAVSLGLGLNLATSVQGLKEFTGVPGRMRLLPGIKKTFIIDDTYNASPEAMVMAIETLAGLDSRGRKWAILGEMLELGENTVKLHEQVGQRLAELNIDYLITCGEMAGYIADAAAKSGFNPNNIFKFTDKQIAGLHLQDSLKPGDLILVKGSRGLKRETAGTRMEKIVKEIMAEPQKADKLLYFTN